MSQIFPPTSGGAERMCSDFNLRLLGKVPLDPRIAQSCDEGKSFLREVPDSPAAKVYQNIVQSEFFFFPKCTLKHFWSQKLYRKCRLSGKSGVSWLDVGLVNVMISGENILKGEVTSLQMGSSHLKRNKWISTQSEYSCIYRVKCGHT